MSHRRVRFGVTSGDFFGRIIQVENHAVLITEEGSGTIIFKDFRHIDQGTLQIILMLDHLLRMDFLGFSRRIADKGIQILKRQTVSHSDKRGSQAD